MGTTAYNPFGNITSANVHTYGNTQWEDLLTPYRGQTYTGEVLYGSGED